MRIGIMLRSIDETGGIGIYARNIVEELLQIDQENSYFLFFRTKKHFTRYAGHENALAQLVPAPNKPLWDQVAVPLAARRNDVDLIFNPKFTVPFLTTRKTVMVVHGADWFIPPYDQVYNRIDTLYIKAVMPLYFRKASFVISVSDYSTEGFSRALPQFRDKIRTIYFAPNKVFQRIEDQATLRRIREKYALPDRYLLTIIRYDPGRKKRRKNFGNMAKAFALCRRWHRIPHKLVVVGKDCDRFGRDNDLAALGIQNHVHFTGLVEQEDLPAFYTMADLYLYPTVIEAFPIPITEAMACGCPIVTSRGTGLEELAGGAGVLCDPNDPEDICGGILQVLSDPDLRERLARIGLERARLFSWSRCARETLKVFTVLHTGSGATGELMQS